MSGTTAAPATGPRHVKLASARTLVSAGVEAWGQGLHRSGRVVSATQALNSEYADRFLKLNLAAMPCAAAGEAALTRSLSVSGQWLELYARYLSDFGDVFTRALREDGR